jgi:hypothetical protein
MTDADADTAADIRVRLNTAILALRSAREITPQRNPFREVDRMIGEALAEAIAARHLCQKL